MENRERDRVSQRTTPTDAGEVNRQVEEEKGRRQHGDTTAEFGQNIGESEFPSEEGGRSSGSPNEVGSTGSSEGRH